MAWSGYVALGTLASGVFTESSATAYARQIFNFGACINGKTQGFGPAVTFTATSANVTTYNAYAFYSGSSGGNPVLNYPLLNTYTFGLTASYTLNPYSVAFILPDAVTVDRLPIDAGQAGVVAGTNASFATRSYVDALTAHAGGGQGSALALTAGINRVTTVGTAADSVVLPFAEPGMEVVVINAAASNSMNIFPASGDLINALSANTAIACAANKVMHFFCASAGKWNSLLTA